VATVKSYALMSLHFLEAATIWSKLFGLMRTTLSLLASFRLVPCVTWMLDKAAPPFFRELGLIPFVMENGRAPGGWRITMDDGRCDSTRSCKR
jgi:hypothetical protein